MIELYPLKFKSQFKEKIWGGDKIKSVLGKDFSPLPNCGESWEISGVEGNVSVVNGGELDGVALDKLINEYQGELVGNKVFRQYEVEFPLLVKFLDAREDLSIQVHPDDALAKKRYSARGKTEMWYIIQADKGAKLISGFNQPLDRDTYLKYFEEKRLQEILNTEQVKEDDVFFIPAGRVHTIGSGILLAEIQQTSDVTYRIYDFDREDKEGNKRELHTEKAVDAIDYKHYDEYKTKYENKFNEVISLVSNQYFTTNKLHCNRPVARDYKKLDSFVIYICIDGAATLSYGKQEMRIAKGETVLVPASIKEVKLAPSPECKLLESYID